MQIVHLITFVIGFIFAANKSAFYDFGEQRRKAAKILAYFLSGHNMTRVTPLAARVRSGGSTASFLSLRIPLARNKVYIKVQLTLVQKYSLIPVVTLLKPVNFK